MTATTLVSDNGASSGITGYQLTGGNDGTLQIQTTTSGGTATTALSISNTQVVTFTNPPLGVDAFASGTALMFVQTAAPTGWTKSTAHNNKALRVVSGTAGTGGTVAFTTAFASQTPTINTSGLSAGATTLTEAQIPSHTHTYPLPLPTGGAYKATMFNGTSQSYTTYTSYATGGGGSHSHSMSGSATSSAIDLAVQYVDVIIATKD